MASLIQRLKYWLKSPQGKRAMYEAKRLAKDPHRRRQVKDAVRKFRGGKGGHGHGNPPRQRYRP